MSPDGSKRAVFAVLTATARSRRRIPNSRSTASRPPERSIRSICPPRPTREARRHAHRHDLQLGARPHAFRHRARAQRDHGLDARRPTTRSSGSRASGTFTAPELNTPVDLTPAVPEIANPGFASNTTLAGNADFYVANRGNGTIVRMRQDGTVVAVRRVKLPTRQPLGRDRINGIAVSPDAQKIWVTVSGAILSYPNAPGVLLEVPAFGAAHAEMPNQPTYAEQTPAASDLVTQGGRLFVANFTPAQGLGPLYNRPSCVLCHGSPTTGGMGWDGLGLVQRVGRFARESFDPLIGAGGPVAREHSIAELGVACDLTAGPPASANLISVRNAPPLYGLGLIDRIPDAVIREAAAASSATKGRAHIVRNALGNERVGRFGWKADTATLEQFVGEAFRNELGITNPIAPADLVSPRSGCGGQASAKLKDDGTMVQAVTAYIGSMPPPPSKVSPQHRAGATAVLDDRVRGVPHAGAACQWRRRSALFGPAPARSGARHGRPRCAR